MRSSSLICLQVLVLLDCVLQDRVTNLSGRLVLVLADHLFDQEAVLLVAAVVDPVGIKKEQVSRAHQGDFCHV